MFHYLDKYARDDTFVKLIFDHVKNLSVITFVLAAATWEQKHVHPDWMGILNILCGAVLGFVGFALTWLNHENLFYKIRGVANSRWVKLVAAIIYAAAFGSLFSYALRG